MDTINITAGCDETFVVTLYKNGVIFPVESATNVTVRLLAFKKTINCEYSITASGELTFTLTGMDKAGIYDLEISGNLDGYAWRTCGRNVIEYTYETVKGDTSAVVAGDDFDISMEVQLYVGESGSTGGFVTEEQLQEVADSIPEYLSELTEDTEHQTVSDEEKTRWNNNSAPTKLSELENDVPYATQTWVSSQGFVTSLAGYATETWVSQQGYLTEHQSLAGYATETWVSSQGFVTSLDGYATETWVSSQGYLTEHQSLSGYATQTWVNSQGYLTSHQDISGKEDKMAISTQGNSSFTAAVNTYYRFTVAVGTITITLPTPSDTTKVSTIVFNMTTGASPAVTITSSSTVYFQDGYELEASTMYEINALYNGANWIVMATKIATS